MAMSRRMFMASLGGVATANLIASGACSNAPEAAAGRPPARSQTFDPRVVHDRANADGEFLLFARYWDARLRLEIADRPYDVVVRGGRIAEFAPATAAGAPDVRVAGPAQAWSEGFGAHGLTVEGEMVGHVWPYYGAIVRLITLVRDASGGQAPGTLDKEVTRQFDTAVGRYVYVRIQGVQYRVYYEETGQGIPIVLQHTAGADGRQWRHLLEDTEVQKRFRMIAYDLPYHGKSVPPTSVPWWTQEYRLTTELLMDSVVEISHALKLDRPVYMGCSIGGYLAPDLALYRAKEFRAVVGINAGPGAGATARAATQMGRPDVNKHPRISNASTLARYSYHYSMSTVSPEPYRRETGWVYSQGGPGIFAGDLYYWNVDHDLTGGKARKIDTSQIGVYFLNGEYDATVTSHSIDDLVAQIPGCTHQVIKGGSHFAMCDNYPLFRRYLLPVLEEIRAKHA